MSPIVVVFGFLAGATILLGLPIARLRQPAPTLRILLNAGAVGVLLFLVWDVLSHAWASSYSGLYLSSGSWSACLVSPCSRNAG
jgi:hypothetical protein